MDISDVARASGLPASTLRYYEEKGLIRSLARNGIRRQFGDDVLARLVLIQLGQQAGFSLADIAAMLAGDGMQINRQRLRDKAQEIDRQISQLKAIRNVLELAADCPAAHHLDCPRFRKWMTRAQKKRTLPAKHFSDKRQ